jgi:hypothetical protein
LCRLFSGELTRKGCGLATALDAHFPWSSPRDNVSFGISQGYDRIIKRSQNMGHTNGLYLL